jgi:hypothetical protein
MNLSTVPAAGWALLAASIVAALLIDVGIVRLLMEFLNPPSAHVFWIGRVGKLVAALAWWVFALNFWYGQFLSAGQPPNSIFKAAATAYVLVLLLFAGVTYPRRPRNV